MVALPLPNNTIDKIYKLYETQERRRSYLGGSQIGVSCERALWLDYRWAGAVENHTGRLKRLFQTGHREEARILRELEKIGIELIPPTDGNSQHGFIAIMGHFRGHFDGIGKGFEEAPKAIHIIELKTHNEKSYKDVVSKGVKLSKPMHYAQMQIYMHYTGHHRAFYLAVNKNTDELYQERIAYDATEAMRLVAKAERIINSNFLPPKISDKKDWFECRWCKHWDFCHDDKSINLPSRNCRNCVSSTPAEGGFHCNRLNTIRDVKEQDEGCGKHLYLPELVHGEVTNCTDDSVSYNLNSGSFWIDGETNGG